MRVVGTLENMFLNRRDSGSSRKRFGQKMLTLVTFLLCISSGFGEDKPSDCEVQDPESCSSPCTYLKDKCTFDLCSYLYPQLSSRHLDKYWHLFSDCNYENRLRSKRGFLNKNVAYLLLKLHPFLNQTSQYGFLTSGRFRRITGSFGTEFLGKRSSTDANAFRFFRGRGQNPGKLKTFTSQFYSLPLEKFAKGRMLRRSENFPQEFGDEREQSLSIRGNGKVVLGSEFLGKRKFLENDRLRRLTGTEFLGKRNDDSFDGSEFLGKRVLVSRGGVDSSEKSPGVPRWG